MQPVVVIPSAAGLPQSGAVDLDNLSTRTVANGFRSLDAEFARDGPVLRRRFMRVQTVADPSDVPILQTQLPAAAVGDVVVAYRTLRRDVLGGAAAAIGNEAASVAVSTGVRFNPAESRAAYDRMLTRLGPDPVEESLVNHLNGLPEAPDASPVATTLLRRLLDDPTERRILELGIEGMLAHFGQIATRGNAPMVDRLRDLLAEATRGDASPGDALLRLLNAAEASLPAGTSPADLSEAGAAAAAMIDAAGFRGLPPLETSLARRVIAAVLTRAVVCAPLPIHRQAPGAAVVVRSVPPVPQRSGMFERLEAALNKRLNGYSLAEWLSIGENALMRARLYGMTADWAGKFLPSPLRHAGHALALWRGATAGAALERDRVQHLAHTTIAHSRNQLEQAVLQTYAAIWWELRTPPRALLHAGSPLEQAQAQWRAAIDAEVALFRSATRALQSGSVAPGQKTQPGARP